MGKPAEIKTKQNDGDVAAFIAGLADEQQRKDSEELVQMMEKVMKEPPKMWGTAMIGFGLKRYKSERSGREVDWFKIGFSPRKAKLSLHLVIDMEKHAATLAKLGKHKTGSGCLYINKLADVDRKVLEQMLRTAAKK